MGATDGERCLDRAPQRGGVEVGEFGDQHQIDKVFGAAAWLGFLIAAGVGMQLLGHLGLQRECWHGDRWQAGKREQIRGGERFDSFCRKHPEPDVEEDLELAAGQQRRHTEPAAPAELVLRRAGTLDTEGEEITSVVISCVQERVEELVLAVSPVEVDVLGRGRARSGVGQARSHP